MLLYAVISGMERVVGNCTIEQAQLMKTEGILKSVHGQLWLGTKVPDASSWQGKTITKVPSVKIEDGVVLKVKPKHDLKSVLEDAGVEYGDWVHIFANAKSSYPVEVKCSSMKEFLTEFCTRKEHGTVAYDDVRSRTIGFIDNATNEFLYISITRIKGLTDQDIPETLGVSAEILCDMLCTEEGRAQFFGSEFNTIESPQEEIEPTVWGETEPEEPNKVYQGPETFRSY